MESGSTVIVQNYTEEAQTWLLNTSQYLCVMYRNEGKKMSSH